MKMNYKTLATSMLSVALLLTTGGCIREEAPNSEAAIDGCDGKDVQLYRINPDKSMSVYIPKWADMAAQQLLFTLPEGASIAPVNPAPGDKAAESVYDFSGDNNPREFVVTAEDGAWKTAYRIRIIQAELPLNYHFDQLYPNEKGTYDILWEEDRDNGYILQWESGNAGYELTSMAKNRSQYPTVQDAAGYRGSCVKLTTCTTGSFGTMLNPPMPIAAGNLFIGSFDLGSALTNALGATHFGFPFYKVPKTFSGYYKYKAGNQLTDAQGNSVAGKDECDIYAVMYEVTGNAGYLDGGNSLTSSNIVLLARLSADERKAESDEWKHFEMNFEPKNGKTIDAAKLKAGRYKLAIVCSSSVNGAYFKGAVGSTLYVDELSLTAE